MNEKEASKNSLTYAAVPVQKNIDTILDLEKETVQSRSTAEHLAGGVTTFAGSGPYILLHVVCLG